MKRAEKQRRRDHPQWLRSEEHTSELQSPCNLVCRLLLEKIKHIIPMLGGCRLAQCPCRPRSTRRSSSFHRLSSARPIPPTRYWYMDSCAPFSFPLHL